MSTCTRTTSRIASTAPCPRPFRRAPAARRGAWRRPQIACRGNRARRSGAEDTCRWSDRRSARPRSKVPRRIERPCDIGFALRQIEPFLVPLEHGVPADDALFVAALVRPPAMRVGMFALAHCRRAGMHRHPLEHVRVFRLRALGIRLPMQLLADRTEVVEEHLASRIGRPMQARTITALGLRARVLEVDGGDHGDPIVLIHGVGGWAETWRAVIEFIRYSRSS